MSDLPLIISYCLSSISSALELVDCGAGWCRSRTYVQANLDSQSTLLADELPQSTAIALLRVSLSQCQCVRPASYDEYLAEPLKLPQLKTSKRDQKGNRTRLRQKAGSQ